MAWSWHESLWNLLSVVLSSRILLKSCIDKSIQIRTKLPSLPSPRFFYSARPSQNPPLRNGPTSGAISLNWSSGPLVPSCQIELHCFVAFTSFTEAPRKLHVGDRWNAASSSDNNTQKVTRQVLCLLPFEVLLVTHTRLMDANGLKLTKYHSILQHFWWFKLGLHYGDSYYFDIYWKLQDCIHQQQWTNLWSS